MLKWFLIAFFAVIGLVALYGLFTKNEKHKELIATFFAFFILPGG